MIRTRRKNEYDDDETTMSTVKIVKLIDAREERRIVEARYRKDPTIGQRVGTTHTHAYLIYRNMINYLDAFEWKLKSC